MEAYGDKKYPMNQHHKVWTRKAERLPGLRASQQGPQTSRVEERRTRRTPETPERQKKLLKDLEGPEQTGERSEGEAEGLKEPQDLRNSREKWVATLR